MPPPLTRRVEIRAPLATVWLHIDDETHIKAWMPEVVDIRYPEGKNAASPVGTRFVQTLKEDGRVKDYDGVVLAYEPQRLLGVRLGDKNFHVDVTYRLEAAPGGSTILHYACQTTPHTWLARLLIPIGTPFMKRLLDRHMERLQAQCEGATAA